MVVRGLGTGLLLGVVSFIVGVVSTAGSLFAVCSGVSTEVALRGLALGAGGLGLGL